MKAVRPLICTFVLLLGSSSAAAQTADKAIRSASISIEVSGENQLIVTLTNHSKTPIEAWEFAGSFTSRSLGTRRFRQDSDTFAFQYLGSDPPPGDGPIKPGESRRLVQSAPDLTGRETVRLSLLLFTDLTWEGEHASLERLLGKRETFGFEAEHWIKVLDAALAMQVGTGRDYLLSETRNRSVPNPDYSRPAVI